MKCVSCNKETVDGVLFPCPQCKENIFRCSKCRALSIGYNCKCGHKGP